MLRFASLLFFTLALSRAGAESITEDVGKLTCLNADQTALLQSRVAIEEAPVTSFGSVSYGPTKIPQTTPELFKGWSKSRIESRLDRVMSEYGDHKDDPTEGDEDYGLPEDASSSDGNNDEEDAQAQAHSNRPTSSIRSYLNQLADVQAELKSIENKLLTAEDELAKSQADDEDIIPDLRSKKPKVSAPRPPSLQLALAYMVAIAISAAVCTLGMLAYCNAWPFTLIFDEPLSIVKFVQGYAMSDRFAGNLIYSIIVPDSLALSAAISESATYSGWVIGIYKGLAWAGLGVGMLMCCIRNKHWMRNMWYCIFVGKLMALVGSVMFLIIVIYRDSVPNARMWLLSSRSLAGIGVGIVVLPIELVFVHTTTASERPLLLSKAVFNVTLGIGLGPLVASATRAVHESICGSDYGAMEAVMCWPVMVSLVSFAAVFYLPAAEHYIDTGSEGFQAIQEKATDGGARLGFVEEPDFSHRRVGIITCALIIGLRGVIVSGLEAATAMILERDYRISKNMVGLAIGLTFLVSVPARLMFGISKDWFSIREWIRLTMCLSFIGSIFLFRAVERFVSRDVDTPAILLLAADSLLYCSIYQVSGLVEGVMTTFALPFGSIFTVDNVIVLKILCLDCVGRLLGPPFARMQVEAGGQENGQDGYAWQQLSMTLLATLLTEAVLLRVMERVEKHRGSKNLDKEAADDTDTSHREIKRP